MLSLKALDDIQLVYLTSLAIVYRDKFHFEKVLNQNLFRMNQKLVIVQSIFECFNQIISTKLVENFKLRQIFTGADIEGRKREWNDRKKIVCAMLSILQKISFPLNHSSS